VSYNVTDKSGEVTVLDPVDFLQFAGITGAIRAVSSPAISAFRQLYPTVTQQAGKVGAPLAPLTVPITTQIKNALSGLIKKPVVQAGTGAGAATVTAASIAPKTISTSTKALLGTGITAVPLTAGILSLTPGGQNLVNTAGQTSQNITDLTKPFTRALSNPIILIALIGLGALVVLKK